MEKTIINVGIIDDDETKRTQLISKLEDFVDGASSEVRERYKNYELNPVELEIKADIKELIDDIVDYEIDVLIVDYMLSSYEVSNYNGVTFAEEAEKKYMGFPVFLLTSYETELYRKEIFDAYKVYDFERYIADENERIEINTKIVEQYMKRKKQIGEWKRRLQELLPRQGESEQIDEEILQLDSCLERSFDGEHAISESLKEKLVGDNFETLLSQLDELLKEEGESQRAEDKGEDTGKVI